jgi:hypothetical protein
MSLFGLRGQKVKIAPLVCVKHLVNRIVVVDVDKVPVIKAGAFQAAVVGGKAERAHKVQAKAAGRAKAGDIAGIAGYFRLDEDYAHFLSLAPNGVFAARRLALSHYSTIRRRGKYPNDCGKGLAGRRRRSFLSMFTNNLLYSLFFAKILSYIVFSGVQGLAAL